MHLKLSANRSYLFSLLVSFSILLLVPLFLFSFVFKNHYTHTLQDEIRKNNQSKLESMAAMLDNDLRAMDQIVTQVALTPEFRQVKSVTDV